MSNEMNLPWNVYRINSIRGSIIDSERSTVTNHIDPSRAAHIVRCVNSHDALVRALQHLADLHESNMAEIGLAPIDSITLSNARAALAAARGEL